MRIGLIAPIIEQVPPRLHGSAERTVALLAEGLEDRGHAVTVFASGDSQVRARLIAPVAHAMRFSDVDRTEATLLHVAKAYERASEFDVIHNHAGAIAFPFARAASVPTVTTTYGRLDAPGMRHLLDSFSEQALVATSWAQRSRLPCADWRATLHGAVDIHQFRFRADPGSYLVYVGRIGPEKRLEWAIDLAREVGRQLVIAGWVSQNDQSYFDHVLAPRIRNAPHVEDLAEIEDWEKDALLGGAYAFVYPASDAGASGLPLLEAMSTGTPVLAVEGSPASELVRDGVTGLVCKSLGEMVAAVEQVHGLDRKSARNHVARRFSPAALARRYEQVYLGLNGNPLGAASLHMLVAPEGGRASDGAWPVQTNGSVITAETP